MIIGTSHIAKQSIQEIKKAVLELEPDIIALELDPPRAAALLEARKRTLSLADIFRIGVKSFIFARLGQTIQQKLGKMVGVEPGSEMKTALLLAKEQNKMVALIDQPLQTTLHNLSKNITWRERGRFVIDIIKGLLFPKRQMQEYGFTEFDLRKVPGTELIEKMMGHLQLRYPSVYKTIVEDRNKYMVRKLVQLVKSQPDKKILVIVGAGHKQGMEELLRKIDIP